MNIVETDFWCLMLPPEWMAEQTEEVVRIVDPDQIGELAITSLMCEVDQQTPDDIKRMAQTESPEITDWQNARFGAFEGLSGRFEEDETIVTEWYLSHGRILLYITYICEREDAGMDAAAIDEILDTLVPGDAVSES